MTSIGTTNVRLSPPPPELMRLINPVVRRVLATPFLGSRIRRQGMVEFTGRRTGRNLRIPVCLHRVGDETLIFTERGWRHNLAGGAPVTVTHRGQLRHGRAVLVDATPSQVGAAMRAAMDDGARPFELGLKITRGCDPTADDLAVIARSIIRVDFED
ncbi:nitroreductase/quinone reductase family protein [Nocardia sp. IBHARD005]|uniref:nitroreductase/quinone reductase family protein n=1 Tax=Nocardia sp. IBHARD005 TaxID=3457765 RepID=UPI00405979AE